MLREWVREKSWVYVPHHSLREWAAAREIPVEIQGKHGGETIIDHWLICRTSYFLPKSTLGLPPQRRGSARSTPRTRWAVRPSNVEGNGPVPWPNGGLQKVVQLLSEGSPDAKIWRYSSSCESPRSNESDGSSESTALVPHSRKHPSLHSFETNFIWTESPSPGLE